MNDDTPSEGPAGHTTPHDDTDQVRRLALAEGRWMHELITDWAMAEAQCEVLGPGPSAYGEQRQRQDRALVRQLTDGTDAEIRAGVLCLLQHGDEPSGWPEQFTQRRLSWGGRETALLWRLLESRCAYDARKWLPCALPTLRHLSDRGLRELAPALRIVEQRLAAGDVSKYDGTAAYVQELRSYLRALDGPSVALPHAVLPPRDAWAVELRSWVEARASAPVVDLLVHCATLHPTRRPTRAWQRGCLELDGEEARRLPREAVEILLRCEPTTLRRHGMDQEVLLDHVRNVDVARGLIWAFALLEQEAAVALLERVFFRTALGSSHWPEPPVATVAIHALGEIDSSGARAALEGLRPSAFDKSVLKTMDAALCKHAKRAA